MIKDGLELLQKYGAKNLFFIAAIVYLYLSIQKTEKKIEVIEAKLYDCYEDRIMNSRTASNTFEIPQPIEAILPDEKINIRYTRAKREL